MAKTPSSLRREGRNAYVYGEHPKTLCPYKDEYKRVNWATGWYEADADYKAQLKADADRDEDEAMIRCMIDSLDESKELKEVLRHIAGLRGY
jgi:ribosome modulation factor